MKEEVISPNHKGRFHFQPVNPWSPEGVEGIGGMRSIETPETLSALLNGEAGRDISGAVDERIGIAISQISESISSRCSSYAHALGIQRDVLSRSVTEIDNVLKLHQENPKVHKMMLRERKRLVKDIQKITEEINKSTRDMAEKESVVVKDMTAHRKELCNAVTHVVSHHSDIVHAVQDYTGTKQDNEYSATTPLANFGGNGRFFSPQVFSHVRGTVRVASQAVNLDTPPFTNFPWALRMNHLSKLNRATTHVDQGYHTDPKIVDAHIKEIPHPRVIELLQVISERYYRALTRNKQLAA